MEAPAPWACIPMLHPWEVFSPHPPLEGSVAATLSRCHGRPARLTGKSFPLRREKALWHFQFPPCFQPPEARALIFCSSRVVITHLPVRPHAKHPVTCGRSSVRRGSVSYLLLLSAEEQEVGTRIGPTPMNGAKRNKRVDPTRQIPYDKVLVDGHLMVS